MAELKTKKNEASVDAFIGSISDENKKAACKTIRNMMVEITGEKGSMWGSGIVGYGKYHYKYASGREGDWMLTGFSPRKQALTIYIMTGFKKYRDLLKDLGKFKTGSSCLYIMNLEDVDIKVLRSLIEKSVEYLKLTYPA